MEYDDEVGSSGVNQMTELQQLHQEREALRKQVREQQMQIEEKEENPNGLKKNMISEAYDDGVNDGDIGGSQQRLTHMPTPQKSKLPKSIGITSSTTPRKPKQKQGYLKYTNYDVETLKR